MNDEIDRKIEAALRRDPASDVILAEPKNIAEEFFLSFRTRQRWLSALLILANFGTLVGVAWAVYEFCRTSEIIDALRWGGVALAFFFVFVVLKIWFWLEIHTNRVLREVKRVELLLLSKKNG